MSEGIIVQLFWSLFGALFPDLCFVRFFIVFVFPLGLHFGALWETFVAPAFQSISEWIWGVPQGARRERHFVLEVVLPLRSLTFSLKPVFFIYVFEGFQIWVFWFRMVIYLRLPLSEVLRQSSTLMDTRDFLRESGGNSRVEGPAVGTPHASTCQRHGGGYVY